MEESPMIPQNRAQFNNEYDDSIEDINDSDFYNDNRFKQTAQ